MEKKRVKLRRHRMVRHLGKVSLAVLCLVFTTSPVNSSEISEVLGTEGGKKALDEALKISKTKPALSVAAAITCLACIPAAGVAASPTMCIACGILIAKVLG